MIELTVSDQLVTMSRMEFAMCIFVAVVAGAACARLIAALSAGGR